MPESQRQRAAVKRRIPVVWDHRKDKFMLLALFSQLNVRTADFDQLADVLGTDIYSADVLRKRFVELRRIATEVFDDRQDRNADITTLEDQANDREESPDLLTGEPAFQALQSLHIRPASQRQESNASEPVASLPTPAPRRRREDNAVKPMASPLTPVPPRWQENNDPDATAHSQMPTPRPELRLSVQLTPPSSASSNKTRSENEVRARTEPPRPTVLRTSQKPEHTSHPDLYG
ncbi:hypothetical protein BDW74DRAFT_176196 [Aspergillus multicolor]|uniref:uncharacterized protein n=1 Tax=Aspergillus multicolor TaxID=41759 RepID=UPI003CCE5309